MIDIFFVVLGAVAAIGIASILAAGYHRRSSGEVLRDDVDSRRAFYSSLCQSGLMPSSRPDPKPGNEVA